MSNAVVETLSTPRSLSVGSKSSPQPLSTSIVEDSGNLEPKDRARITNIDVDTSCTISVFNTKAHRVKARIQFSSLCYSLFLAGWNDGTTGPLLPRIQQVYHVRPSALTYRKHWPDLQVGFAIVSLIFVFACFVSVGYPGNFWRQSWYLLQGFVSGAFLNFAITDRLGFGKVGSPLQ